MACLKRIILDVLKPHQPNALEFSKAIANVGSDYRVHLTVITMDKATETIQIEIEGGALDFESIQSSINAMGGSLHSIDEVVVHSDSKVE
ncbi:MAG: hypothetical protein ACI9KN_001838 [Gammaproteobacteria bacterium]|jgi:hypothetical protein